MSDNLAPSMEGNGIWSGPTTPSTNKRSRRLGCPFAKCFPQEFDADSPCTRRYGFDGYRLLNAHIRKYHSYLFSCETCGKGFPEASQKDIERRKADHHKQKHAHRTDQYNRDMDSGSPVGSRGQRKRQKKSSVPEVPAGDEQDSYDSNEVPSTGGQARRRRRRKSKQMEKYPKRMTQIQDEAFEDWMKSCEKINSREENVKKKYHSLCRSLFGNDILLPTDPYYDFLVPYHLVKGLWESNGLSVAELESQLSVLDIAQQPVTVPSSENPYSSSPMNDKNQAADPYSLGDKSGAAPTEWRVVQGPDSGFYSWEQEIRPKLLQQQQQPTLGYSAGTAGNDGGCDPNSASRVPADSTWLRDNSSFSPSSLFNNEAVFGIAVERIAPPDQLIDEDHSFTPRNPTIDPMDLMDHY